MSSPLRFLRPALALAVALNLAACQGSQTAAPTTRYVVHGVVTDAKTGELLEGARVSFFGTEPLSVATTADGYFRFADVSTAHEGIVQASKDGFQARSVRVRLDLSRAFGTDASGTVLVDASLALEPLVPAATDGFVLPVAGWVYGAGQPAKGALVALYDTTPTKERYAYQTTCDDQGRFVLPSVKVSRYELRVWPYDRDGNGIADFRLHARNLGQLDATAQTEQNLTNLTVNLQETAPDLQGGGFVSLSTRSPARPSGYPVSITELQVGIEAVLPHDQKLFLHWGAEVDADTAVFELHYLDTSGDLGPVVPVTATWQSNRVIVELTPGRSLFEDSDVASRFRLLITSLRLRDGTVLISPEEQLPGSITFDPWKLPTVLASPQPAPYVADRTTGLQTATAVAFDAAGGWLLDANGDFVGDPIPANHWTNATGIALSWAHVPGATDYRVYARSSLATGPDDRREWKPVRVDGWRPLGNDVYAASTIIASGALRGDFGRFGLEWEGVPYPLLARATLELAVTSVNAQGVESPIDGAKTLTLSDTARPMLTSVDADFAGAGLLARSLEQGAGFKRIVRMQFSEPVNPAFPPQLAVKSGNLSLTSAGTPIWSASHPDTTPAHATEVYLPVNLRARGPCTALTLDRAGVPASVNIARGDKQLFVRDASIFTSGDARRIVFLTAGFGYVTEAAGIASVDTAANLVTLNAGLEVSLPAGTLACFVSAGADHVQSILSFQNRTENGANAVDIAVTDPGIFYRGERVLVFKPADTNGGVALAEVRTVTHVNTETLRMRLSETVSASHSMDSILIPLQVAPEYGLRPRRELALVQDVDGASGALLTLPTNLPPAAQPAQDLMRGDALLIDADGDLRTTTDRFEGTIRSIKQIPDDPATVGVIEESSAITVDLPAMKIVRGRSRVMALGDTFAVTGIHDTSHDAPSETLNTRRDSFSFEAGTGAVFLY